MSRLAWYAGRAAAMSPGEMIWRAGRLGQNVAHRIRPHSYDESTMLVDSTSDWTVLRERFCEGAGRPVLLDQERARRIAAQFPGDVDTVMADADRLVAGERVYFGYPSVSIGRDVDWNYDPLARYRWPAAASSTIDHRRANSDPKWIWELNRLQHLPVLAQAWLFSGEPRYAEVAFEHLDSWCDQNPVGIGIAWRGAFEAGIRAISVAIAVQGLRDSPLLTTERYRRVLRLLDESARYCWRDRSRFSSANNHLVGELTGLIVVHLLFPELAAPVSVYPQALELLSAEAERQILSDGAGAEQAISYQMFTAELLATVVALMQIGRDYVPPRLLSALERSARYIVAVVGPDDPDPRYGDDDDGFALRLGPESKRTVREHLGIVSAVTGSPSAASHCHPSLTATWFATALDAEIPGCGVRTAPGEPTPSVYAEQGGLVVLRSERRRLTVDVGPLGYLSIAAHGHADALSTTLSVDGHDVIVDPGAGSYYGNPSWRAAHRGTRVHATVSVDGVDQSVIGGPFFWSRHATTTVHAVDLDRGIVDAEHDGYRRLDDPVLHRRWVIAPPLDPTVLVVDLLDGRSAHDFRISWPLHPDLDAVPTEGGHLVNRQGIPVLQLSYAATSPIATDQVRADSQTQLGWWSERLEARTPAWLVGACCRSTAPLAVLSVLRTADVGVITEAEIVRHGAILAASWCERGVRRGVTIDIDSGGVVVNVPSSDLRSAERS